MKYVIIRIMMILVLGSIGQAWAGSATLTLFSHHFDEPSCDPDTGRQHDDERCAYILENGYNEANPGMIFEWDKEPDRGWEGTGESSTYLFAGPVKASFDEWIGVFGLGARFLRHGSNYLCAEVGGAVNYSRGSLVNLCGVMGSLKLSYLPEFGDDNSDSVWLGLRFDF